jgi:transposase
MAASSIDLRQKILRACERQLGSQRRIADVFGVSLAFVEKVVRQHRTTGDIAPKPHAHEAIGVRQALARRGARLLSLPLYSPDLSPIEPCWSKVKTILRTAKARTREASTWPSQQPWPPSRTRMHKGGFGIAATPYDNAKIALSSGQ